MLHELDQRQRLVEDDLEENTRRFTTMAAKLDVVHNGQVQLSSSVQNGSQRAIEGALQRIKQESHDGAERGAMPAIWGSQALQRASQAYDDCKQHLTYLAAIGLPVAFCVAVGLGLLFANFGMRTLPHQWQWTCKIVGAQHWEPESGGTYCIIRKD